MISGTFSTGVRLRSQRTPLIDLPLYRSMLPSLSIPASCPIAPEVLTVFAIRYQAFQGPQLVLPCAHAKGAEGPIHIRYNSVDARRHVVSSYVMKHCHGPYEHQVKLTVALRMRIPNRNAAIKESKDEDSPAIPGEILALQLTAAIRTAHFVDILSSGTRVRVVVSWLICAEDELSEI